MSTNTEVEKVARRIRDEVLNTSVEMLAHLVNQLGTAIALTDTVRGLSYKRGEEHVGTEEDGRVCWVESIALSLECGCIHHVESVGGSITLGKPHLCREHRPVLTVVMTPVDKEIPF